MSFIHSHSCECTKSELDLFSLPPTQLSIERSDYVEYKPVASISENAAIEFCIPGIREEYLDLAQTLLYVKGKIVNAKGEDIKETDNVGLVNNALHSIFSQFDITLNGKHISSITGNYPFAAYLENLLNYDNNTVSTRLENVLFYKDSAGAMDSAGDDNVGLKKRKSRVVKNRGVEMIGQPHISFFNQNKLLINGIDVKVKMTRARDAFSLMSDGTEYKFIVLDATLRVRRVKVNPNIALTHSKILERCNIKYNIERVEVKVQTLSQGSKNHTIDNLVLGQLPKRIIIGFVSNTAYNGDYKKNPFNFHHYNLNHLSLYVDGQQVPSKPLKPDFKNALYTDSYQTLFSGTGIHFGQSTHTITYDEYKGGYCLFAFDLTPDLSAHLSTHWNLIRHGSLRAELGFAEALPEVINMILYAEYDNVIEIDKARNVTTDYGS
jgi:hypothetical protein